MPADEATNALKILYYGVHGILEYDDLKMFLSSGHRVFSMGIFMDPEVVYPTDFRQPEPGFYDLEFLELFKACGCNAANKTVTRAFCNHFDIVIINHYHEWITMHGEAFEDIPVVLRTIGQSNEEVEAAYKHLDPRIRIVRYSQREVGLPGFAKTDAVIYFSKDGNDYLPWLGGAKGLTFHNHFAARDAFGTPKLEEWQHFREQVDIDLYGAWNDGVEHQSGLAASGAVPGLFQRAAFYLYVYTSPPSYTLSLIEAMTAGVPIIAPSAGFVGASVQKVLGDVDLLWQADRYEIDRLLQDGAGFTYDSIDEAIAIARRLLGDPSLARSMSATARDRASSLFGIERIAGQWNGFFREQAIVPR